MAHWGWYWGVKLNHKPKKLCSHFEVLDSFKMFKHKCSIEACMDKVAYSIPATKLKAILHADHYAIEFETKSGCPVSYKIPIERQSCHYGGFRYFFHCPKCEKRMRMLYLAEESVFLCRKCLNLGYFTQRLRPSTRYLIMESKIKDYIKYRGGDVYIKPFRMHKDRYQKLRSKQFYYESKSHQASNKELREWYGPKIEPYLDEYFDYVDESKEWRD